MRASGIVVDVLADREIASAGDTLQGERQRLPARRGAGRSPAPARCVVPAGWTAAPAPPPPRAGANPLRALLPRGADPDRAVPRDGRDRRAVSTQPYWLRTPRTGPVFTWTGVPAALQTRPFDPPAVVARVPLTIGGAAVTVERPVVFRYADSVRGEIRRDVAIVPAVTVAFDETLAIVPAGARRGAATHGPCARAQRDAAVGARRRARAAAGRLEGGAGGAPITFTSRGEGASVPFTVTPPATVAPGAYTLAAQATIGGRTFDTSMQSIDYPHIQKHRLYAPAQMTARVLDLKVAPVKVGYVMGGGDRVPEAIRRLGLDVTLLTDDELASGDLSRYDTIVVGVRASESRPGVRRRQRAAAAVRARRRHADRAVPADRLRRPQPLAVPGRRQRRA